MDWLRKLLYPFAVLYGAVTGIRNRLYDNGRLRSTEFHLPIIAVGNLSVGGTGKSPMVEYLVRLLCKRYKIATLSRGYKRKSKGFVMADANSSAESLGDEPMQFHQKFPDIFVAVDADRTNGIENLIEKANPDVIVLDDALQHRKVKAGFYILLTAYNDLYIDDLLLPAGNLREARSGADRADVIVVTKCPPSLAADEIGRIRAKLKVKASQHVFFSTIDYSEFAMSETQQLPAGILKSEKKLLIAGIAKPEGFFKAMQSGKDKTLEFGDHHDFSPNEIGEIIEKSKGIKILTTEKDYVRLRGKLPEEQLFYLPIEMRFLSGQHDFDRLIHTFVENHHIA